MAASRAAVMPEASEPPACAMLGLPPPRPPTKPAICLMMSPAEKPAATADSVPAARSATLPSEGGEETTQATGSPLAPWGMES